MTLALRLRQEGYDVTLIEGATSLGGLASTWQIGDVVWDRHYHVTLLSDAHLRALLEELGLTDAIQWNETKTGVFADGTLHSVSNALEFLRFPPLGLVDKARLGWTILYGARLRDWRSLESTSVEDWLIRHSGKRTFDRFWRPLLKAKLGDNYVRTSAAFIWATIQRLYAARKNGLDKELFGYVQGGYATVLDRFADRLEAEDVQVLTGSPVRGITRDDTSVKVVVDDTTLRFDRVVVTTAAPIASRLISDLDKQHRSLLEGVEYQGIVCASVLTKRPLGEFYVTNITDDTPFTGVIDMTALVDPVEFGGRGLIYLPKYVTEDDEILQRSDEEIEALFLAGLRSIHPDLGPEDILAFRISRVRYVMPLPTLGYSKRVPSFTTNIPGVFTVNSAQILNGTLNVNETLQLAARAFPVLTEATDETDGILEADVRPLMASGIKGR